MKTDLLPLILSAITPQHPPIFSSSSFREIYASAAKSMPNPGAFHGSRKEFLLSEKKDFAKGVDTGAASEALGIIQRRYFKRYPIDLPHNEEPDAEHLAAVDDDAPEPEIKQPDATKMGPAEYVEAMNRLTERQKKIKKRKAQIKRWLVYQYMKDHDCDPRDRRAHSPYRAYLAKIRGQDQERPRRKSACNVWRKLHRSTIESKARETLATDKIPKSRQAALRDKIARDLFKGLPEAEQKEWAATAESEHEEVMREWKEAREKGPSTSPEDRQRAIQGLVRFVQPVLDVIADATGWQVSLFAGGPEPARQGKLNIISVHSGTMSGDIKLSFGQSERAAIKKDFIPMFGRYLQNCYTPEECRARTIPEDEGYVPISEMEMEGSTGLIHIVSEMASPSAPAEGAVSALTPPPIPVTPTPPAANQAVPSAPAVQVLQATHPVGVTRYSAAMNVPDAHTLPAGVEIPDPASFSNSVDTALEDVTQDPHDNPFPFDYHPLMDSPNSRSTSPQPSGGLPTQSPPPSPTRSTSPQPSGGGLPIQSPPPSPIQGAGSLPIRASSPPLSPTLPILASATSFSSVVPPAAVSLTVAPLSSGKTLTLLWLL